MSLVETVLAVGIMGIAVAALLTGILTVVTSSQDHRDQSSVGALLTSAAEVIADPALTPFDPAACATASAYDDDLTTSSSSGTIVVPAGLPMPTTIVTCTGSQDLQIVRVVIAYRSLSWHLDVMKRDLS